MAWSAPITFVSNAVLTAAQMNAIQANILETAPAKATEASQYFVATGPNAIAARKAVSVVVDTLDTTTSTTYGDLAASSGPVVSVTTGPAALVVVGARVSINASSNYAYMAFSVSGATSRPARDNESLSIRSSSGTGDWHGASTVVLVTGLTPGTNTFRAQYRVSGPATGSYDLRRITVMPL